MPIKMKYGNLRPKWFLGQWLASILLMCFACQSMMIWFQEYRDVEEKWWPSGREISQEKDCAGGWSTVSYGWSTWPWAEPIYVGMSRTMWQQFYYLAITILPACLPLWLVTKELGAINSLIEKGCKWGDLHQIFTNWNIQRMKNTINSSKINIPLLVWDKPYVKYNIDDRNDQY